MKQEKHYIIRCYRNLNDFRRICNQLGCISFDKEEITTYGTLSYIEGWFTPAQYTFLMLMNLPEYFTEYMIRYGFNPTIINEDVNMIFLETYGAIY